MDRRWYRCRRLARAAALAAGIGLGALRVLGLVAPDLSNPGLPESYRQAAFRPSSEVAGVVNPAPVRAQSAAAADLVVDFGDGRMRVERVTVGRAHFTGLTFLDRSTLALVQNGGAVCAIDGVGCPAADCFCQCKNPAASCTYWAYFHGRPDGGWDYDQAGPGNTTVVPGAVEGWVWDGQRPPITTTASMRAVAIGVDWLRSHQTEAGGIADHVGFSTEAAFAARGSGVDPLEWRHGGMSLAGFLGDQAGVYAAEGAAQAGKALAGTVAAGIDPHKVAAGPGSGALTADLVAIVRDHFDPATGRFGTTVWDQAWSMIGLAAAAEDVPPAAVDFLAGAAAPGGGWGFYVRSADADADADSTGLALQALRAAGTPVTATAVTAGLAFLDAQQSPDGGWGHGGPSNANSTAYALQGLVAAGEDPRGARWQADGTGSPSDGPDPVDFLLSAQRPGGYFAFDAYPSNLVATLQVLPALAGRPAPVAGIRLARDRGVAWMLAQQAADGSFAGYNPGATLDAVIALAAAGHEPNPATSSGTTASDYLGAVARDYAGRGASAAGKLSVGIVALGEDPRAFGGDDPADAVDVVAAIRASYQPISGTFGSGGTWDNAWAILGLAAAREPVPAPAVQSLLGGAAAGGGWGFAARADAADVDSTGLALQALAAAHVPAEHPVVRAGIRTLWRSQRGDGGFPGYDGKTSASSSALAIGGLAAFGHAIDGPGWMRGPEGGLARFTAREAIIARQSPRGGFAGFSGPDDPGSTYPAVLGLTGRALPIVGGGTVYVPFALQWTTGRRP